MRQEGRAMNLDAYLKSRTNSERNKILKSARMIGVGVHHAGTAGSSICPPRDIMATRRYKLPTRSEIFSYSQKVDPRERLADTSGKIGATEAIYAGQSRPTMGNNSERYVNGR
jgi:hypothetical protein